MRSTKLKLFQRCVPSPLLYGSECWRVTEHDLKHLSTFHTKRLWNTMIIFWPQKNSNKQNYRTKRYEQHTTKYGR